MRIHILTNPRTGGTYLFDVIYRAVTKNNNWSDDFNEPFQDYDAPPYFFNETIEKKIIRIKNEIQKIKMSPLCIIKNHLWMVLRLKDWGLLDEFLSLINYNILLIRQDIFESALSLSIAEHKNQWILYKDKNKILISPEKFNINFFNQYANTIALIDNEFKLHFNEVVFSDSIGNVTNETYNQLKISKIFPCNDVIDTIVKFAPKKKNIVKNYYQLKEQAILYAKQLKPVDSIKMTGYYIDEITLNNCS